MSLDHEQHLPSERRESSISVFAIPYKPRDSRLKLVSINQYETVSSNGYKQFDINIEHDNQTDSKQTEFATENIKCIKDITRNIININFVTALSLTNCALGSLPEKLSILKLQELDLSQNKFTHIPDCLYFGLNNLEVLNLSSNPIRSFNNVPKCVETLKQLNLNDCYLKNVPVWIQEMKTINLQDFRYRGNTQVSLKRLDRPTLCSRVRKLVISYSGLRQDMLDFVKSLNLLQYLDISNNDDKYWPVYNAFGDISELVDNVSWVQHIKILKLNNLNINELSDKFCTMVKLEEFYLKKNLLLNLPLNIINLKNLVVLDVSENCIYSLPCLSSLSKLEELHASMNHLTMISLLNMPRLKYLDLYGNELEHVEFSFWIEFIDLEWNYIDADVLAGHVGVYADNGNGSYVKCRESLRSTRKIVQKRVIGRKLSQFEVDPPPGEALHDARTDGSGEEDLCYSEERYWEDDNSDEGHDIDNHIQNRRCSTDCGMFGEDNDECKCSDGSDWGETTVDFVTLSDAEFLPEDLQTGYGDKFSENCEDEVSCVPAGDEIELEKLFIDVN